MGSEPFSPFQHLFGRQFLYFLFWSLEEVGPLVGPIRTDAVGDSCRDDSKSLADLLLMLCFAIEQRIELPKRKASKFL